MKYSQEFKDFLGQFEKYDNDYLIGAGNPMSNILLVGQETSDDASSFNSYKYWIDKIKGDYEPICRKFADTELIKDENEKKKAIEWWNKPQSLWRNYQRLFDCISYKYKGDYRKKPLEMDFEHYSFQTEVSGIYCERNAEARKKADHKDEIRKRKEVFFRTSFIQHFPITILACGNYFRNDEYEREINNIFGVTFKERFSFKKQWFCTHYDTTGKKLVIHTRNLSNGVSGDMIKKMGVVVRDHMDDWGLWPDP